MFTVLLQILKTSAGEVHLDVLTCVCVGEGFPSLTVKMLLFENLTENFVTTVSNNAVNISVSVSVEDRSNATVGCLSCNASWEARENLTSVHKEEKGKC